jgi:hypothetical protein
MAGLDICSVLRPGHLVVNRLRGTHELISVQNLMLRSILCGRSQAMCHTTKEHIACCSLSRTRVFEGTQYPTTLEDQGI